jgi:hypothetical protein
MIEGSPTRMSRKTPPRQAVVQGLGRANRAVGGDPEGIKPIDRPIGPPGEWRDPSQKRDEKADDDICRMMNPDDRRAH